MKCKLVLLSIALLSASLVVSNAQGASINWGNVFEIISDADIDLTLPHIVEAVNGGPAGAADIPVDIGGTIVNFVSPDPPVLAAANLGAGGIPEIASTGNAALDEVFESHTWTSGDTTVDAAEFTLSGLSPGASYQVQIVAAADGRGCCLDRSQVFQDTADGSGNNSDPLARASDVGGIGTLHANSVIGTFTADAGTQSVWVAGAVDAGISAYLVTSNVPRVPEPASIALLAVSCLGIVARRR